MADDPPRGPDPPAAAGEEVHRECCVCMVETVEAGNDPPRAFCCSKNHYICVGCFQNYLGCPEKCAIPTVVDEDIAPGAVACASLSDAQKAETREACRYEMADIVDLLTRVGLLSSIDQTTFSRKLPGRGR